MKKPKMNWRYIRPLYLLCNSLAIAPPHLFGSVITPLSTRFRIYTVGHIILSVAIYIHSNYGRDIHLYANMDITVAITDKIANLMLAFSNVAARIILIFYKSNTTKAFFNAGLDMSKLELFKCCSSRSFAIQFAILNLYMLVLLSYDAYFWMSAVGFKIFQFYVGRSLMYYVCNITIFLIFHSVLPIKHFFTCLNRSLETIVKNLICDDESQRDCFRTKTNPTREYNCCDLKRIRKHYTTICSLVDDFNNMYGLVILVIIVVVITYALNLTDMLLVYGVAKVRNIEGIHFGTDLTILCGFWMLTFITFAILLAYGCDGAVTESKKIAKTCYFWLNEIPTMPVSGKELLIKEELLLLAQQATLQCPRFSAAGFFSIDFTLLGFIFGTLTSYIIISLQFIHY